MLLPSTIRSRSAETASSSGGNLAAKSAPATRPSHSAAPLSRRRGATSESRATPLASAHVAAVRRLRPPGSWARTKRSNVAPSPTFRLRTSAPLARAEASRSRTPESLFSSTGQCRSRRDTECGAACIPPRITPLRAASSLKFAPMGLRPFSPKQVSAQNDRRNFPKTGNFVAFRFPAKLVFPRNPTAHAAPRSSAHRRCFAVTEGKARDRHHHTNHRS
jgi:hypothetical protein